MIAQIRREIYALEAKIAVKEKEITRLKKQRTALQNKLAQKTIYASTDYGVIEAMNELRSTRA